MINAITVLLQSLHAMPQCSDGDGGDGGDGNDGGDNTAITNATTTNSAAKSITSGLVNNVISLLRLIAII
jgi:hypothetical protein